jgi:4-hydroxysphinganine ceramide fatty acyl 2-hydroxylase
MIPYVSPIAFGLGALSWSFAEYALHRFSGHGPRAKVSQRKAGLFDGDFGSEHQAHHADTRYFTPTARKLKLAVVALPALAAAGSLVVGPRLACSFVIGFGSAYTFYEIVHRRTHTHAPLGPYARWARRHHLHHHFESPRSNHGVTTPLWDLVFSTHERSARIRVPRRHAPTWLLHPATGEVRSEYASDYELARSRAAAPAPSV